MKVSVTYSIYNDSVRGKIQNKKNKSQKILNTNKKNIHKK